MINLLLIFFGAGLGGVCRYGISHGIAQRLGTDFPYGTLIVNATGSFFMGILFVIILERIGNLAPPLRAFVLIGFLGGYTTFSSFSIETILLFEQGAWMAGILNVLSSVVICITLTGLGMLGGRLL